MVNEKVALITGSSGGIGQAVVERFHRAGWQVVGADRHVPDAGARLDRFAEVDLVAEERIEGLFSELRAQEGRLDALINNAAVQVCRPLGDLSAAEWDAVMAVNLRAPFLCLREALPLLRVSRGSVVNVTSVHVRQSSPEMCVYAASKGGLDALTRAAAVELAALGIRVNSVQPGAVDTSMLRSGLKREHFPVDEGLAVETVAKRQLQRRLAEPEEIAQVIYFLADSELSSSVTGASFVVDGGATARLSTE